MVYTHSNQHVVGGSKAEELISRAAVRDVFEREMYSQLPANNLLGTQEVCTTNADMLQSFYLSIFSKFSPNVLINYDKYNVSYVTDKKGEPKIKNIFIPIFLKCPRGGF